MLGSSLGERLYAKLNGYGSLVVEVTFASPAFRESIEHIVSTSGWAIEDSSNWGSEFRMKLVRTGPRVVGLATRERYIHELGTVLSSTPNPPVVLKPTFVQPDYSQMPRWVVNKGRTYSSPDLLSKHPIYIYGEHRHALRQIKRVFPKGELLPSNAASRLYFQRPSSRPDWTLGTLFLAFAVLGFFTADASVPAFQEVTSTARWVIFTKETWPAADTYVLFFVWWLLCAIIYVALLWIAASAGAFKGSEVSIHWPIPTKPPTAAGWSWSAIASAADNGIRAYMKIQAVAGLLLISGTSVLTGRMLWIGGSIAAGLPGGLLGTAWLAFGLALAWLVTRLVAAHSLLSGRTLRRLVLNLGSTAIVLTLVTRLPVWAYLEGIGTGPLVNAVDWTQIVAFTPTLLLLGGGLALSWLLIWIGKQGGSAMRFLAGAMVAASVLALLLSVTQRELTAGYNLRVQGTEEFARMNYPVPACLQQLNAPKQVQPVWVLGTRDSQTIVTSRSPSSEPLQESGHVSAFPTSSVALTLVPFGYLDADEARQPCQ